MTVSTPASSTTYILKTWTGKNQVYCQAILVHMKYIFFCFLLEISQSTKMGCFCKWSHFLLLSPTTKSSDHQLFYLFLNFYLFWHLWLIMASKSSSLSASLSLWQHLEISSRTCSLSSKCLFTFVNVTWSALQLENQAHLSFANCKVLNYIQGLICRPNPSTQQPAGPRDASTLP